MNLRLNYPGLAIAAALSFSPLYADNNVNPGNEIKQDSLEAIVKEPRNQFVRPATYFVLGSIGLLTAGLVVSYNIVKKSEEKSEENNDI